MPLSTDRHALTSDQRAQLQHDLETVEEILQSTSILMRACYGEDSQAATRADEANGALQRLRWELERNERKTSAAAG